MGEEYSVGELYAKVADMGAELAALKALQAANHSQNRQSIHGINNSLQRLTDALSILSDKVAGLQISNAKWSALSGVITAVVVAVATKLVENWK